MNISIATLCCSDFTGLVYSNFEMNHLAIYTVITGDYDTIKQPQVITPGAEYFLFTNNHEIKDAGVWRVAYLDEDEIDARIPEIASYNACIRNIRLSRKVKMLAHKYLPSGYDMSIYLDADMLIKDDFRGLSNLLNENVLMAAFRHSYCTSVRAEIEDLTNRGVVEQEVIKNQWQKYQEWGFRDDIGVTENGILIRRHNHPKMIELMELWWQEYLQGCLRDQVSLMPCIFKCGFMPYMRFIEGKVRRNEWVEVMRHL